MKSKLLSLTFMLTFCLAIYYRASAHEIMFCGEKIPIDNNFVAQTLMSIIRKEIPNANMPELHKRADLYFPYIESFLEQHGLPDDLKYIPIVESGFENETSSVDAEGIWQLMPSTATDRGLLTKPGNDDRDDLKKSTEAACKTLRLYYSEIKKQFGISSWILTAAAFDLGPGRIFQVIKTQRTTNYFSMDLNNETALYVYKIIAVKELFESPEFYMKDFGYNIFNNVSSSEINQQSFDFNPGLFKSVSVNINPDDGKHTDSISKDYPIRNNYDANAHFVYVAAIITGTYKNFADGDNVKIKLYNDLTVNGSFIRKGNTLLGTGWFIDNRIVIDVGFIDVTVHQLDDGKKGIDTINLKNNQPIFLKVQIN